MKTPSDPFGNPSTVSGIKALIKKYGLEASTGAKPKVYMRNISFESRKFLGQNKMTEGDKTLPRVYSCLYTVLTCLILNEPRSDPSQHSTIKLI